MTINDVFTFFMDLFCYWFYEINDVSLSYFFTFLFSLKIYEFTDKLCYFYLIFISSSIIEWSSSLSFILFKLLITEIFDAWLLFKRNDKFEHLSSWSSAFYLF